jgi:hypothetical protein
MKIKEIKNNKSIDYVLKIANVFNIQTTLNIKYFTNIIEFYENDELIGIINYHICPIMDKYKMFIRSIHYINVTYLDRMIKLFIKTMKEKYVAIFTNIINEQFNKEVIDTLLNNNFNGSEYISLDY